MARLSLIMVLVLVVSGCSLMMNRPRGTADPSRLPDCTQTRAAPTVDLVGGILLSLLGLLVNNIENTVCEDDPDSGCSGDSPVPWVMVGVGVTQLVAAPFGYSWASECRERHRQHDEWLRKQAGPPRATPWQ